MTYDDTVAYLFNCAPPFQQVGGAAYKEGLANTIALDSHLGHPHRNYRTIHVAGTNGKGSTSHTLAAILQENGCKVGLYTSPHLIDFRERIRVNGIPAPEEYVVQFVEKHKSFFEPLQPSFFELTTAMAFSYFAEQKVDIAVIETGMGGRLDCTNIIAPELCIITNISPDHTQFLGSTLAEIAGEKAGIIKHGTPAVIGEATEETREVFKSRANAVEAPIIFAQDNPLLESAKPESSGMLYQTKPYGTIHGELGGFCQEKNTNTILAALECLKESGFAITEESVKKGFRNVCSTTGLMGRWQKISGSPLTVCDAGHNIGGIQYITEQLAAQECSTLRIVFGMVSDKDISAVLAIMPKNARYYFTQASIKRAMPARELQGKAKEYGLNGEHYPNVAEALNAATAESSANDFIFVGGSCFIVADLLASLNKN
ncbi:MAG: bifunctional folylpolyglutamate synthase/dihydrofolate synthase [Bacteroidaceae bacterium]|nr:bifunctional folylpolyglutamate synthase/dihydrofolate synthase [Bacteroidaceae bacterium]